MTPTTAARLRGVLLSAGYLAGLAAYLCTAEGALPEPFAWTPRELAIVALAVSMCALFALTIWMSLLRRGFLTRWLISSCLIGTVLTLGGASSGNRFAPDEAGFAVAAFLVVGAIIAALWPGHWWWVPDLRKADRG